MKTMAMRTLHSAYITTNAMVPIQSIPVDIDGDGDMDVLSASALMMKLPGMKTMVMRILQHILLQVMHCYAQSVYAIDVDSDGDIDVLSASWNDNKIAWYENDGNENFTTHIYRNRCEWCLISFCDRCRR